MNAGEIWRAAPGFPGYQVSSLGRVQSFMRGDLVSSKILQPSRGSASKRAIATLYRDGRPHYRLVARLVCEAFHGTPANGQQAAHVDGDVFNDREDNLAWKTPVENCADRSEHGRTIRGEKHHAAKLTEREVSEIRARYREAKTSGRPYGFVTALAAEYRVALGSIEDVIYGRKWRHVQ